MEAIEASIVPHMKPDDAKSVMERHRRTLVASTEERKPQSPALALLDGFRAHGLAIVEQPVDEAACLTTGRAGTS